MAKFKMVLNYVCFRAQCLNIHGDNLMFYSNICSRCGTQNLINMNDYFAIYELQLF